MLDQFVSFPSQHIQILVDGLRGDHRHGEWSWERGDLGRADV